MHLLVTQVDAVRQVHADAPFCIVIWVVLRPGDFVQRVRRNRSGAERLLRSAEIGAGSAWEAAEGGFWRIALMRCSELTNLRIARDDQLEN